MKPASEMAHQLGMASLKAALGQLLAPLQQTLKT